VTALNNTTLPDIAGRIPVPTYDRTDIRAGIIHIGVGGFHRSHQAMYIDRLLQMGQASQWGIIGIGLLPTDRPMHDVLKAQDGLYTLVLKHPDGTLEPRIIGSIINYLLLADDPEAVLQAMTAPSIKIVSLTVTEGGYNIDHTRGIFNIADPVVTHDLQPDVLPQSLFGVIVEALARRRARGIPAFTVMSCDNIQGNGDTARRVIASYASVKDPELANWIQAVVSFPNSMVDRITPVTTDRDRQQITDRFGLEDGWPVVCEPFTQWVLEDNFTAGRPPYENVGVQLVDDVEPYELMKLRLLNASHQGLCYFGHLAGYTYAHQAAQDPFFSNFLLAYMDREATPSLGPVPGIDLNAYKHQLIERFRNSEVRDTIARLCAESSDRIPKWLLPVIRHNLATGGSIIFSAAIVASWARYAEGTDENGDPILIVDRMKETLMDLAQQQLSRPLAFLQNQEVFGNLADNPRFAAAYLASLTALHTDGAQATLKKLAQSVDDQMFGPSPLRWTPKRDCRSS